MEPTCLLVENHGNALNLEILASDILGFADDLLSNFIRPLLSLAGLVLLNVLTLVINDLIDDLLDLGLD